MRYKLLLSIIVTLISVNILAQQSGLSGLCLMPGVTVNPIMLTKGFSCGTTYSFQFGVNNFPLKGVVRFGFPDYKTSISGGDDYSGNGSYLEPGLILYSVDISKQKASFYIGALAYWAKYNHTISFQIEDSWGIHNFQYSAESKVSGLLLEVGGLFTIFRGLKGTVSADVGGVKRPSNPIPQIQNFFNETYFIPGIGHGLDKALIGLNFGLHYQINMLRR